MAHKNVIQSISARIAPIFSGNAYELCDIEYVKEGPNWYLRIYADKEGCITIDDLEFISKKVEAELDEADPIPDAYILEVSSPGIDRPLKKQEDYVKYNGEIVDIKLYKAQNKTKEFQGKLLGLTDGVVSIEDEEAVKHAFLLTDIASCRLAVFF